MKRTCTPDPPTLQAYRLLACPWRDVPEGRRLDVLRWVHEAGGNAAELATPEELEVAADQEQPSVRDDPRVRALVGWGALGVHHTCKLGLGEVA